MRAVPQQALGLIKLYEGLRLRAYNDGYGYWTIGYGHHAQNIKPGDEITVEQANALLISDATKVLACIETAVTVPINDNQLSALMSLTFNIGEGNFLGSGLLKVLNEGNYSDVPNHIAGWNKVRGEVSTGLTRRRTAEIALWSKDDAAAT